MTLRTTHLTTDDIAGTIDIPVSSVGNDTGGAVQLYAEDDNAINGTDYSFIAQSHAGAPPHASTKFTVPVEIEDTGDPSKDTKYFDIFADFPNGDVHDYRVAIYPDGVDNNPHARIPPDTNNVSPDLLNQLGDIRDAYRLVVGDDATLYVNSGTEGQHASNSQHYLGRALDFQLPPGFTNDQREELVQNLRDVLPDRDRIGLSTRNGQGKIDGANFADNPPGHLHIDLGRQAPSAGLSAFLHQSPDLTGESANHIMVSHNNIFS